MNELRRWSEEGATATELSLLEVSRREHAPARARERALQALGITAVLSTVATTTTTAAATNGGALLLKFLGISALGGGLVVGGLAVHRTLRAPASGAVSQAISKPSANLKARAPQVVAEAPAQVPSAAILGAPSSAPSSATASNVAPRSARVEAGSGGLSREVAALELAHRALAAHNPNSALHLLDSYRAEFPHGALGSEASVLRVQALLASGNRAAAQALADSYSSRHPDSPYARRIQDILHSGR